MPTSKTPGLISYQEQLRHQSRGIGSGAIISNDRLHRYALWRRWKTTGDTILFIGLNPSTADEKSNDPTIRRCISFAEREGASAVMVVNLFAYRATLPGDLFRANNPIGPENDLWIQAATQITKQTVACWGNHGTFMERGCQVASLLSDPRCFGLTKLGEPKHPLYLHGTTPLISMRRG